MPWRPVLGSLIQPHEQHATHSSPVSGKRASTVMEWSTNTRQAYAYLCRRRTGRPEITEDEIRARVAADQAREDELRAQARAEADEA